MPTLEATAEQQAAVAKRLSPDERERLAAAFAQWRAAAKAREAGTPLPEEAEEAAQTAIEADREEIEAAMRRVREARHRMETAWKAPPTQGRFSHEPTPEREQHAANGIAGNVVIPGSVKVRATKSHRVQSFVDRILKDLEPEERQAIDWVLRLAEATTHVNLTASYEGATSGGAPGRKFGGLGNVPQRVRDDYALFQRITQTVHEQFVRTLRDLVLEQRFGDGRSVDPQDFAARMFPLHRDKSFRRGVATASVKLLACRLLEIYYRERALSRGGV